MGQPGFCKILQFPAAFREKLRAHVVCPFYPDLLFLAFSKTARKTHQKAGFLLLAKPRKSLGKKGKTLKIARNSLKRKKARKTKQARNKTIRVIQVDTYRGQKDAKH